MILPVYRAIILFYASLLKMIPPGWIVPAKPSPLVILGDFTDDRTVLACTPEGGKLMHTPKYTTEENLEKRKANFMLNEAGELDGDMETVFKGTDYDDRDADNRRSTQRNG